jgi:hypothetical protein
MISQGLAPGLSLSIIVSLLLMGGAKISQDGGQIRFYLRIYCRTLGIVW